MKESLFIKNFLIGVLALFTLSGCVQSSAFLGPAAVTGASTGSALQAGISYSTNYTVTKITGKTPIENFQKLLIQKVEDNKIMDSINKSITKKTIDKKTIAKKSSEFYRVVANLYSKENSNP